MELILLGAFVLTGYHFVYESVIATHLRCHLRYKIYELRDELINLKIDHKSEFDDDTFDSMLYSINRLMQTLADVTIMRLSAGRKFINNNESVKLDLEQKIEEINNYKLKEVREMEDKATFYFFSALVINSGGWAPIAIPFLIILGLMMYTTRQANRCKKWLFDYFQWASYSTNSDLELN